MTQVIAEAGVAHQGSLEKACALVRHAVDAGADAVKFQAYEADEFPWKNHATTDTLRRCQLKPEDFGVLAAYCAHLGIEFLCTPFQAKWVPLLDALKVKRFKASSQSVDNAALLAAIRATSKPLIISNGMCTESELRDAVAPWGRNATILSCVSKYPTEETDIDLTAMTRLLVEFPDCDIGWSDHTRGMFACVAAAKMGAAVVEKHMTLGDSNEPDACCSLDPAALKHMVSQIRVVTR